jgi:hypothetical protein
MSGLATSITVKKHSSTRHPAFQCPLVVLCDGPEFTKVCMSAAPAPECSLLAPAKTRAATPASDPGVFSFHLGEAAVPTPSQPSDHVTDEIALVNTELWIAGVQVPTTSCLVATTDSTVLFGPVEFPLIPRSRLQERDLAKLERAYSQVPRFNELRQNGLSRDAALAQYKAELKQVFNDAHAAYKAAGHTAAETVLRESSLIGSVEPTADGKFTIQCTGTPFPIHHNCRLRPLETDPESVRRRQQESVKRLIPYIKRLVANGHALIVIDEGYVLRSFNGDEAALVSQQLRHVAQGGDLSHLPDGPLDARDRTLQSVMERLGRDR